LRLNIGFNCASASDGNFRDTNIHDVLRQIKLVQVADTETLTCRK